MSGTSQKWDGRWEQLKGRVKSLYAKLTDDEITEAEGDYQRLVGLIEERTGEAREEIERKLSQ